MRRKLSKQMRHYLSVHGWLRRTYGKASKCEGKKCPKLSQRFEWAQIKGKPMAKKRECFMQLCRHCHLTYDWPAYSRMEKPKFWGFRAEKKHRRIARRYAKKLNVSESEIVRRSLEEYDAAHRTVIYKLPSGEKGEKGIKGE